MRFHVLGLSHCPTTREFSACAFSQKARLLSKMLRRLDHEVFFYGVEGSEVECTEFVSVLGSEAWKKNHAYDWKKTGFDLQIDNPAHKEFVVNAIAAIAQRAQRNDFLLCTFGMAHKAVADALPGLIAVEPGIGYEQTFAKWRVFESYAWMHFLYGREGRSLTPVFYDAVIPNYYDLGDYPFRIRKRPYFLFVGRPTELKGLRIASDVCKKIGAKLYAAGQGELPEGVEAEWLGVLSIEERGKWMGGARALFAPTYYVEPFGSVVIEAGFCGTPVITTDFGSFTETVRHGITGYRCRTFEQFVWAAEHIKYIDPTECRQNAVLNYGLDRISKMYEEYFDMLTRLHNDPKGWYAENPRRKNLSWLTRLH
jgi:glycosyltransferase involved in cell wall biosynthesis